MLRQESLFNDADLEEHVFEQFLELSAKYQHREDSFGWMFDDRLIVRKAEQEDEENSHYQLFQDDPIFFRARFRGWFNEDSNTTSIQDRQGEVRHADQIPERLYRALTNKFGKDIKFIFA